MTTDTKTKEKNAIFLQDSFILKLLRDNSMKEYLIRIIASILKVHPEILGEDFEIVNAKIGASTDIKNMESDIVIKCRYGYFDVEVNFNPLTPEADNKNISYICSLVLKQVKVGKDYMYGDILPVILINLSRFDYFKKGKFIYVSSVIEEELHLKRTDMFKIVDLSLAYLKKMSYNEIKNLDINTPEKLLYILTCEDRKLWKTLYGDDEFMKKVEEKINDLDVLLDAYMDYDREAFLERTKRKGYDLLFEEELREEGRQEERLNNAKTLIKRGLDKDIIINALNLTEEEIEALDL